MARDLKYTKIGMLLTLMLVKQQQLSFFFILVSHIKLVKYTMVLQQWTGWLRSKKEVLQLHLQLQLVLGIFNETR
jgi:hypothetical protein